jgi:hypothetical protein
MVALLDGVPADLGLPGLAGPRLAGEQLCIASSTRPTF